MINISCIFSDVNTTSQHSELHDNLLKDSPEECHTRQLLPSNEDTANSLSLRFLIAAETNCDLSPTEEVKIATLIEPTEAVAGLPTVSNSEKTKNANHLITSTQATREDNKLDPEVSNLPNTANSSLENNQSQTLESAESQEQIEKSEHLLPEPSVFKPNKTSTESLLILKELPVKATLDGNQPYQAIQESPVESTMQAAEFQTSSSLSNVTIPIESADVMTKVFLQANDGLPITPKLAKPSSMIFLPKRSSPVPNDLIENVQEVPVQSPKETNVTIVNEDLLEVQEQSEETAALTKEIHLETVEKDSNEILNQDFVEEEGDYSPEEELHLYLSDSEEEEKCTDDKVPTTKPIKQETPQSTDINVLSKTHKVTNSTDFYQLDQRQVTDIPIDSNASVLNTENDPQIDSLLEDSTQRIEIKTEKSEIQSGMLPTTDIELEQASNLHPTFQNLESDNNALATNTTQSEKEQTILKVTESDLKQSNVIKKTVFGPLNSSSETEKSPSTSLSSPPSIKQTIRDRTILNEDAKLKYNFRSKLTIPLKYRSEEEEDGCAQSDTNKPTTATTTATPPKRKYTKRKRDINIQSEEAYFSDLSQEDYEDLVLLPSSESEGENSAIGKQSNSVPGHSRGLPRHRKQRTSDGKRSQAIRYNSLTANKNEAFDINAALLSLRPFPQRDPKNQKNKIVLRKLGSPSSNSETEKWQIVELHHAPVLPDTPSSSSAEVPNSASLLGVSSKATTKASSVELLLNPTINPITSESVILAKVKADPKKSMQPTASEKSVLAKSLATLAIQETKRLSTYESIPTESDKPTKSSTKSLATLAMQKTRPPLTTTLIPTDSETPTKSITKSITKSLVILAAQQTKTSSPIPLIPTESNTPAKAKRETHLKEKSATETKKSEAIKKLATPAAPATLKLTKAATTPVTLRAKTKQTSSSTTAKFLPREQNHLLESRGDPRNVKKRIVEYSEVIWSLKNDFKNEMKSCDRLFCEDCQKTFSSTKALINHTITNHSQVTFQCKKCDLVVKHACHLMEHYYADHVKKNCEG